MHGTFTRIALCTRILLVNDLGLFWRSLNAVPVSHSTLWYLSED